MEGVLVNIAINVLRIFVRSFVRGNNLTFHLDELHTELCRNMCKTKKKDKNDMRGRLLSVLNALTAKKILFLNYDNWTARHAPQIKAKDKKKVYGLTNNTALFLELQQNSGHSLESAGCIKNVLVHFGLLDPVTSETEVHVATETVAAEEQNTPVAETRNTEVAVATTANDMSNNINDIIDAILAESQSEQTTLVPAQLLADLVRADAVSAENFASSRRLDWTTGSYKKAMQVLRQHNLITTTARLVPKDDGTTYERAYGIWLTDLGQRVAEAGNFLEKYPSVSRARRAVQMVADKGAKKRNAQTGAQSAGVVYGRLTRPDGTEMLIYDRDLARQLLDGGVNTAAPAAPDARVRPVVVEPSIYETMGSVISGAVTGLYDGIASAHPTQIKKNKPGTKITSSNCYGLSTGLSRLGEIIDEMRKYCNYCRAHGVDIDLDFVARYCDAVVSSAAKFGAGGRVPLMEFPVIEGFKKTICSDVTTTTYKECKDVIATVESEALVK